MTDFQPANIVVDGGRITFLELSKLGWDWTERRAVQYLTGADDRALTLLDRDVVQASRLDAAAVDGHHLLFLLLVARRVLMAGPVDVERLVRGLSAPLSQDRAVGDIRRALQPLTSTWRTVT